MPRYVADEHLPYFCTIRVLDWLPVLIEKRYIEPIIDSLNFCRVNKGLQVFGFVVMPNHLHLIVGAVGKGFPKVWCEKGFSHQEDMGGEKGILRQREAGRESVAAASLHAIMRDFKRFTSRTIHDRMKVDCRATLLYWLRHATQEARQKHHELGLWDDGFHPQAIQDRAMFEQKLAYIHENPVRKGLVIRPEDWWYSSAAWYAGRLDRCMEIDQLDI